MKAGVISVIVVLSLAFGIVLGVVFPSKYEKVVVPIYEVREVHPSPPSEIKWVKGYGIAVYEDNVSGEAVQIMVGIKRGNGNVFLDVENNVFGEDFQETFSTIKSVVQKLTGKELNKYDIFIKLNSKAWKIYGTSGSALIAAALYAALENKSLFDNATISATILPDGSLGEVAKLDVKLKVAKENGFDTFIMPLSECTNISGIRSVCVENIKDALPFLVKKY